LRLISFDRLGSHVEVIPRKTEGRDELIGDERNQSKDKDEGYDPSADAGHESRAVLVVQGRLVLSE
jgi:hypothetical protein